MIFFPFPQFCTIHRNFIYFYSFLCKKMCFAHSRDFIKRQEAHFFRAYGPGIFAHSAPKYLTKQ